MTNDVFEDHQSIEVSNGRGRDLEVFALDDQVVVTVSEEMDWDSQRASFTMNAAEATRLKEFLIKQGY